MRRIVCVLLVTVETVVYALPAFGWGQEGHRIIAKIAYDNMTCRARKQVDKILGITADGKVVYLKLVGHCGSCPFAMMTLKQGIEVSLREIDPEITVERVEA